MSPEDPARQPIVSCSRYSFNKDTSEYSLPKALQSLQQQTVLSATIRWQNLNGQNFTGHGTLPLPQRAVVFPDTTASQQNGVTLTARGVTLKFTFDYDHANGNGDSIFMQSLGAHGTVGLVLDLLVVPYVP